MPKGDVYKIGLIHLFDQENRLIGTLQRTADDEWKANAWKPGETDPTLLGTFKSWKEAEGAVLGHFNVQGDEEDEPKKAK